MPKVIKIVDLSQNLDEQTQVYPGDPHPTFEPTATIENHGYNILQVCMGSQSGTHADAPYHFIQEGKTIEACDLSLFVGEGIIISVLDRKPHQPILLKDVSPYLPQMEPGKIVIFHTGWSKYNRTDQYYEHPYLSVEAAKAILDRGIRTFALDAINIDDTGTNEYPVHHLILGEDGIIIENLTNLAAIDFHRPFLSLLPLKMTGADGAPMRAVALQFAEID
ncbi:Kynurenine formamidase [Seinonella peptonophila]|uniref:Kynurenine formamidase n=2 Tax=Seinonella peptonophila TaxID=112248 RepID=A0A1M4YE36_9BACL|nr:Kynurenine formamidase [Seinonella peptonophila]